MFNHDLRGKLSGGTIHTMLGVMNRPFSQMSNVLAGEPSLPSLH